MFDDGYYRGYHCLSSSEGIVELSLVNNLEYMMIWEVALDGVISMMRQVLTMFTSGLKALPSY